MHGLTRDSEFCKFFVLVLLCFVYDVNAMSIEWEMLTPQQAFGSRNAASYTGRSDDVLEIDAPDGGLLSGGYPIRGAYPKQIDVYLSRNKSKKDHRPHSSETNSEYHSLEDSHSRENSRSHEDLLSKEDSRGDSRTSRSDEDPFSDEDPLSDEHHNKSDRSHEKHHTPSAEQLDEEHFVQAEFDAAMANNYKKAGEMERENAHRHEEMAKQHHAIGDEEAAEREEEMASISYGMAETDDKLAEGHKIEALQEAEMAVDDDEHHGDGDHNDQKDNHGDENDDYDHQQDEQPSDEKEDTSDGSIPIEHTEGNESDEFKDANDEFDEEEDDDSAIEIEHIDNEDNKEHHKIDRRSPDFGSWLPSASATAEASSTATADGAKATALSNTEASIDSTDYSEDTTSDTSLDTNDYYTDTSAIPTTVDSSSDSSSSWFSWFSSDDNTPTYSPYTLLQYLAPQDTSPEAMMAMFSVFSDPTNSSYLSNASTLFRIVIFFMPGTGIVDQVYFTMALSKIMWEAATMYYDGYGTVPIAVTVLYDLTSASYLSRRDESFISQTILEPGETINIDGMDVPSFLQYIRNMEYPTLVQEQEQKLRKDIENLVDITFPNISNELETSFADGLEDAMKFLALFNVKGDLKVDNVEVNFADVYTTMHSAFDTESIIEKIRKKISGAIDEITSHF